MISMYKAPNSWDVQKTICCGFVGCKEVLDGEGDQQQIYYLPRPEVLGAWKQAALTDGEADFQRKKYQPSLGSNVELSK